MKAKPGKKVDLLVGGDGIALETFLRTAVTRWLQT
jgi:hypothetical protein